MDHALACLLGLLGLRVAEACSINIEDLSIERGHRVVTVIGKGSKLAVIPLPPRVARAVDAAAGQRISGPLLLTRAGHRMNRPAATRIVRRVATSAGVTKHASPHSLRHSFITAALDAGGGLARRPGRGPPLRPQDHHPLRPGANPTSTGTPATCSPPTSPAPTKTPTDAHPIHTGGAAETAPFLYPWPRDQAHRSPPTLARAGDHLLTYSGPSWTPQSRGHMGRSATGATVSGPTDRSAPTNAGENRLERDSQIHDSSAQFVTRRQQNAGSERAR